MLCHLMVSGRNTTLLRVLFQKYSKGKRVAHVLYWYILLKCHKSHWDQSLQSAKIKSVDYIYNI